MAGEWSRARSHLTDQDFPEHRDSKKRFGPVGDSEKRLSKSVPGVLQNLMLAAKGGPKGPSWRGERAPGGLGWGEGRGGGAAVANALLVATELGAGRPEQEYRRKKNGSTGTPAQPI